MAQVNLTMNEADVLKLKRDIIAEFTKTMRDIDKKAEVARQEDAIQETAHLLAYFKRRLVEEGFTDSEAFTMMRCYLVELLRS